MLEVKGQSGLQSTAPELNCSVGLLSRLGLQLIVEEIYDALEEVVASVAAHDEMIAVRVNLHLKLLACLHVGFAHLSAIAEVDIVVGSAVNEKWFDNALVDSANRKVLSIIE